ncbi:MAG TPA: aminomethyl-transferring glycine dehydrogenase subunit GcvPA [Bacilli bacterium]
MFKYFPHTQEDIKEMLQKIGIKNIDDLFSDIDPQLLKHSEINIPSSHSEEELRKEVKRLASKNEQLISFLGAGSYDVYTPSVCKAITSRQEFLTSYTPYQPEISQGTLQYIFEFQSMICELTGMDVSNASMYDGATATAEAMFMAVNHTRRNTIILSSTISPRVREVVETYAQFRNIKIVLLDNENYYPSILDLKHKLNNDVAAVIFSNPNFYGIIEDYQDFTQLIKDNKSLLIINSDPSTLAVLKSPREWGADIACGEAQTLGIPLSFGGPYLGYLATTNALLRKLPGRICGMTTDVDGKRAFVLTLQAREQHIRREKANSNICSNQSLMALNAVIYMSLMGKTGLENVAYRAYNNAHYLYEELLKTNLFEKTTDNDFFKEFVLRFKGDANRLNEFLLEHHYLGGLVLEDNKILFCCTEKRTKQEIDDFVRLVGEAHV